MDIKAGDHTFFSVDMKAMRATCLHGGWSGEVEFNRDGTLDVDVGFKVIHYDYWVKEEYES